MHTYKHVQGLIIEWQVTDQGLGSAQMFPSFLFQMKQTTPLGILLPGQLAIPKQNETKYKTGFQSLFIGWIYVAKLSIFKTVLSQDTFTVKRMKFTTI